MEVTNIAEIPDALEIGKLIVENDRIRVLDFKLKPNEKMPMHNHPYGNVVYFLTNAKVRLTFPDGKSQEFENKEGQAIWIEAGSHAVDNIGNTEAHHIVVEVK